MTSKRYAEEFKVEAVKQIIDRGHVDYIEMFYNPKRRHSYSNRLSPVNYEKQYEERLTSG